MATVLVAGAGGTVGTQMGEALRPWGLKRFCMTYSVLDVTNSRVAQVHRTVATRRLVPSGTGPAVLSGLRTVCV